MPRAPLAAAAVLALLSFAVPACAATIDVAGTTRSYLVHQPRGGAARPVVFVFHGAGGDAASMERFSGFDAAADANGFVAVYLDGVAREWNDAREEYGGADDVGFVRTLIARLVADGVADPTRIYAAGFSNGGFFAHRLGCELADRIAAIAAVGATIGTPLAPRCAPARAVRVFESIGTSDPWVPYRGGIATLGGPERGPTMSVEGTMQLWRGLDHCVGSLRERAGQAGVTRIDYCSERPDTLVLYRAERVGHVWPPDAAATIWSFFAGRDR